MADATCDVMKCESCRTPMLTYYTSDRLILYVCPNCVDWSASETQNKQLFFIN
jgi:ssDNA-binding Zn-finger/Zn-ribbon topoisomerase 1